MAKKPQPKSELPASHEIGPTSVKTTTSFQFMRNIVRLIEHLV